MLYDREKDLLEIKASRGLSERAIENVKLKMGEGIGGRVAQTGEPILINDTTKNHFYKDFFKESEKGRPRETLLCLPLKFKEDILGVVTLDSKFSGKQFIRNDKRLLSILASQAAVAINNARMYKMAITDPLTKLYMRRFFLTRLDQEIEKAKRYSGKFSLLFLDIDHFKKFNDTYGHQMGDRALMHLADIMKSTTRGADICGRYGGEEFVILLPETPKERAVILAERLREKVDNSTFKVDGRKYKIRICIGVAGYNSSVKTPKDLIREADKKLYRAKEEGRNKVVS
ncbi:MAG: sensor domain-containing diguanylate cyclase, partial [Elusimicrobiota bacterium]